MTATLSSRPYPCPEAMPPPLKTDCTRFPLEGDVTLRAGGIPVLVPSGWCVGLEGGELLGWAVALEVGGLSVGSSVYCNSSSSSSTS